MPLHGGRTYNTLDWPLHIRLQKSKSKFSFKVPILQHWILLSLSLEAYARFDRPNNQAFYRLHSVLYV
jgi:hypothetical protein